MSEDTAEEGYTDIYDQDWIDLFSVAIGIDVLTYKDGTVRIRHNCVRKWDSSLKLRCAPELQLKNGGHRIVSKDPFTVEPSIQCPDCDLHGFITNGAWRPV